MQQPEMQLDEAANIAQQYVKHFRAFEKMHQMIELVRGLEGRKKNLEEVCHIMGERHQELLRMVEEATEKETQAVLQHDAQIKFLDEQQAATKRLMEEALAEYRLAHQQARENVVAEHERQVAEIELATTKANERLVALSKEVEHMEERKQAIQAELLALLPGK